MLYKSVKEEADRELEGLLGEGKDDDKDKGEELERQYLMREKVMD